MNDGHASFLNRLVRIAVQGLVMIVTMLLILQLVAEHLLELLVVGGAVVLVYIGTHVRRYRRSRW